MKTTKLILCALLCACQTTKEATPPPESPKAATAPAQSSAPLKLTIVGTNDMHGWVSGQVAKFPRGEVRYGGLAAFAGYVNILRAENPGGVILLDAGDIFQGTLLANLSEGSVVIEAFNLVGYDAAAIGNHEFDYGPVGPISAATHPSMDPFGALKERIAQARFPLLSANTYDDQSGARPEWLPGDGTVILERNGVKVGIIGLTTPQTPTVTLPINVASLKFRPLASEALGAATRLREKGADVVIAVVHGGGRCENVERPHDLSSCDVDTGEIFEMMKGLPEATLDAVVAGHTHARIAQFFNGTPIIESFSYGRAFGLIELQLDPETKKVLPQKTSLKAGIEICETWDVETKTCDVTKLRAREELVTPVQARFRDAPVVVDASVADAMRPAHEAVEELQKKELGLTVPVALTRAYENESTLGNFFTDSLKGLAKADLALMNPGGFRAELPAGKLTYGAVYEVVPFDNAVAILDVTGEQLGALLTAAYGSRKGVFQVSGLEVKLSRCLVPDRLRGFTLTGGKKVDPNKRYKVAMPDFLARGGDGLAPVLATIDPAQVDLQENKGSNIRDELIHYWQEKKETFKVPKGGRVTFVDRGEACAETGNTRMQ